MVAVAAALMSSFDLLSGAGLSLWEEAEEDLWWMWLVGEEEEEM